jgi:hypothetical protein
VRKPRTKKAMVAYLCDHFRYHTMNSWNRATSYAACIKLHKIMPGDLDGYAFLQTDEAFREGNEIIEEFSRRWHHEWQIGSNGRSGGYLVLYKGGTKPSGYKRYCAYCGQQNYRRGVPEGVLKDNSPEGTVYFYALTHTAWVPDVYPTQSEIAVLGLPKEKVIKIVKRAKADVKKNGEVGANQCGRCNREGGMRDYGKTHMQIYTQPGLGVDEDMEDFESWDAWQLQQRVNVVWDFDKTVEGVIKAFIDFVRNHTVVEKEILVPKTIHVAVPKGEEDEDDE